MDSIQSIQERLEWLIQAYKKVGRINEVSIVSQRRMLKWILDGIDVARMNKKICMMCISEDKWMKWTDEDEIEWKKGKLLTCPKVRDALYGKANINIDEFWEKCNYHLEHMVSELDE